MSNISGDGKLLYEYISHHISIKPVVKFKFSGESNLRVSIWSGTILYIFGIKLKFLKANKAAGSLEIFFSPLKFIFYILIPFSSK